ncbi:MAG: 7-carboxy-7-deazaguanine synthase QueE [Peptococcaceae bacterium]|nr:7-carboxy-7-deazaguanine synthase QueE [Peptococcaceae bacterium]
MTPSNISEIFSSIQGEGPYIGYRQIFIRFFGCNLDCAYCDTFHNKGICRIEAIPGSKKFIELANPLDLLKLENTLEILISSVQHHSISLTGGEPLLQIDFLKEFLSSFKSEKLKIFLETNGTLPENLKNIINQVDIVAMDIKLPSVTRDKPQWDEHYKFLKIANETEVFVKAVINDECLTSDFDKALEIICEIDNNIPLIIQPLTKNGRCLLSPGVGLKFQATALKKLKEVRIIPQAHIMMNQL